MKKYPLLLLMLCISGVLKAQTDTVAAKIKKIPIIRVDALAKFPGGDFAKYIAANIRYKNKSDRNLRGQLIISVKIDSNGHVSDVNVLKNMSPDIDQEVTHVIKASPKWQPALFKGRPIGVYMVFNIDMGVIGSLSPPGNTKPPIPNTSQIIKKPVTKPVTNGPKLPLSINRTVPNRASVAKNKPIKAIKKQTPPFDKKPISIVKKTNPKPVKKSAQLPITPKAKPVAVKKVASVPNKKNIPLTVNKKSHLNIVKKAAPKIAKKAPTPVVKKVVPHVMPKPIKQVAKKTNKPIRQVVKRTAVVPVKKITQHVIKSKPQIAKQKVHTKTVVKRKRLIARQSRKVAIGDLNSTLGPSSEAQFPNGGLAAFFRYLSENIHYPILSKINKIEGEVHLTFVVDKDGTITDVKIVSAPAEDLAEEAKRVILGGPRWKPAMQNGVFIKETFTVPINFKLQEKQPQQ